MNPYRRNQGSLRKQLRPWGSPLAQCTLISGQKPFSGAAKMKNIMFLVRRFRFPVALFVCVYIYIYMEHERITFRMPEYNLYCHLNNSFPLLNPDSTYNLRLDCAIFLILQLPRNINNIYSS